MSIQNPPAIYPTVQQYIGVPSHSSRQPEVIVNVPMISGGVVCQKCGFQGRHKLRLICGRVAKAWSIFFCLCGMPCAADCYPRMYDKLMICSKCGGDVIITEARCCDIK